MLKDPNDERSSNAASIPPPLLFAHTFPHMFLLSVSQKCHWQNSLLIKKVFKCNKGLMCCRGVSYALCSLCTYDPAICNMIIYPLLLSPSVSHSHFSLFPSQAEIVKRLSAICAQIIPFLSQEVSVTAARDIYTCTSNMLAQKRGENHSHLRHFPPEYQKSIIYCIQDILTVEEFKY